MVLEFLETLVCFASHFWPLAEILTRGDRCLLTLKSWGSWNEVLRHLHGIDKRQGIERGCVEWLKLYCSHLQNPSRTYFPSYFKSASSAWDFWRLLVGGQDFGGAAQVVADATTPAFVLGIVQIFQAVQVSRHLHNDEIPIDYLTGLHLGQALFQPTFREVYAWMPHFRLAHHFAHYTTWKNDSDK